jgi:hypothetical protein
MNIRQQKHDNLDGRDDRFAWPYKNHGAPAPLKSHVAFCSLDTSTEYVA